MLYRQTRVGKDGVDFELLKLRTMVVGAERMGAGYAVDKGDSRITRSGAHPAQALARRAAAALERRARRHVADRAAADAALPGRPLRRAAAPPPRRAARHHRLGADPRPHDAAVVGADRARPLVRPAPQRPPRPEDPAAHAARPLRRHLQGRDRRLEGRPTSCGSAAPAESMSSRKASRPGRGSQPRSSAMRLGSAAIASGSDGRMNAGSTTTAGSPESSNVAPQPSGSSPSRRQASWKPASAKARSTSSHTWWSRPVPST